MNLKTILCLVVAAAFMLTASAGEKKAKKAKPVRAEMVSISETEIVIKLKKENKTYTITEETKILNENGEAVKAEEFKSKMVELTTDPADATKVTEVKPLPAPKPKAPKVKKPEPKPEPEDAPAEDME